MNRSACFTTEQGSIRKRVSVFCGKRAREKLEQVVGLHFLDQVAADRRTYGRRKQEVKSTFPIGHRSAFKRSMADLLVDEAKPLSGVESEWFKSVE